MPMEEPMTTARLMDYLPDRNGVATALGLRRRQPLGLVVGLGLLGAGMLIGSAVALLLTPRSGADLRRDLKHRMDDVLQRVQRSGVDGEDRPGARA
jgi:hypothetical protein